LDPVEGVANSELVGREREAREIGGHNDVWRAGGARSPRSTGDVKLEKLRGDRVAGISSEKRISKKD
jgi:hypothetical protein